MSRESKQACPLPTPSRPLPPLPFTPCAAARGVDYEAVCHAADELRRRVCGDTVSYAVNRNINYTNVCTFGCSFCAFRQARARLPPAGAVELVGHPRCAARQQQEWRFRLLTPPRLPQAPCLQQGQGSRGAAGGALPAAA